MFRVEKEKFVIVPLTEKGMLKPTVTKAIKEHMNAQLVAKGFIEGENSQLYLQVGETSEGNPVYYRLDPVVTTKIGVTKKAVDIDELTGFLATE